MHNLRCNLLNIFVVLLSFMAFARATENGAGVYPAGVETVMPGRLPAPGDSMLLMFNNFYQANQLLGSDGRSVVPGFHLRVGATAPKFVHNWGVRLLGGTLVSSAAVPVIYEHLNAPFGKADKTGLGNWDIGVAAVRYQSGNWHWWYGMDLYTPAASYKKSDLINIGQHYFATAPLGAFSYLPDRGKTEISSKFQYIVNYEDSATHYRSGNEFIWEYAGMRNVSRNLALGAMGFYYQQTTDDLQNGLQYAGGNRGRDFAVGPQARYHLGHVGLVLKYQREMLVENRTCGNSFWLQLGIPLNHTEN